MKVLKIKVIYLTMLFFAFVLSISCSQDTDLLVDYVAVDSAEARLTGNILVNDSYKIPGNNTVILDVLANDIISDPEKVKIVQTSQPDNGIVIINDDKTLTYIPDDLQGKESDDEDDIENENSPEETGESTDKDSNDSFTYTTETELEGGDKEVNEASVVISNDFWELKAFPTAEGFGKNATGGRGGRVVEVTNLNDSGEGSLREALKMTGARTIVFKVGGTIECKSYLSIPFGSGNVTVAGQTAPGGGIQIKNAELRIQDSNVIVRYLKIRLGHDVTDPSNEDGIRILSWKNRVTKDVIIDHCSVAWGKDENFEIGGMGGTSSVKDITVQNCIIAENIIDSKYGMILWRRATNISVFRNLFAHHSARNLAATTCESKFEFVNNLVYGYKTGTDPSYENHFDIIGNVYKPSKNIATKYENVRLEKSGTNCPDGDITLTKGYVRDNLFVGGNTTVSSNLTPYLSKTRVINSGIAIILPSNEVEKSIIDDVGASLFRDDADLRVINDVINSSGSYNQNDSNARNFPFIENGETYVDKDSDGIDDVWEIENGLNPENGNDGNNVNGIGYTNLELFLHDLTLR
ncbi:pectate lyase family protein [Zobellia russellii]|uniref:pectate lyase family protein n=1 Tax=Zobellia russellii TaxID=248907 RepID=UPI001BFF12A8|nr:hypothetical protein [Zobellia russellii]MBT9189035.1 hypothetical protein [Zobellia russellii]